MLTNVTLPRFAGVVVWEFGFVGSFCRPVRGDTELLWKGFGPRRLHRKEGF